MQVAEQSVLGDIEIPAFAERNLKTVIVKIEGFSDTQLRTILGLTIF